MAAQDGEARQGGARSPVAAEASHLDALAGVSALQRGAQRRHELRRATADVFASWVDAAAARVTAHGVRQR